jgi:hypothetical protein
MILPIRATILTEALVAWLRRAHDDDTPALRVFSHGETVTVLRHDGADLSETEEIEVRALLAAHQVEPLRMPRGEKP